MAYSSSGLLALTLTVLFVSQKRQQQFPKLLKIHLFAQSVKEVCEKDFPEDVLKYEKMREELNYDFFSTAYPSPFLRPVDNMTAGDA